MKQLGEIDLVHHDTISTCFNNYTLRPKTSKNKNYTLYIDR